jgi:enhancer of polycomb-like protein
MSKLSFRARALDATKSLPIYRDHEIPDNADCSNINRTVPQMPSGMEKEEESEQHLQQAIHAGTVIPTPEVFDLEDLSYYGMLYPEDYKMPRQLIYMQPFSMEADIPDYDMDSDDEHWVNLQTVKLELTPDKFEEMMDRLEKGSGQTVVTLQEAKALIKEDDDLIIAVYDYWLNKRLKTQHPLIPQVRTEARFGVSNHNPYIAFRRRTEKMETRKNRKNDESSYEKMLKLKRDLSRAVTLLEMVKRREKSKRELLHLSIEVFEKRYQAGDFSGHIVAEALSQRPSRPAFTPLFQPNHLGWSKDDPLLASASRKEKRHYKKRRHKAISKNQTSSSSGNAVFHPVQGLGFTPEDDISSSEETPVQISPSEAEEEEDTGPFAFRRRLNCDYQAPAEFYPWVWCSNEEEKTSDKKYLFCPTSLPKRSGEGHRYIGRARRRIGRGGRVILDRMGYQGIQEHIPLNGASGPSLNCPKDLEKLPENVQLDPIDKVPGTPVLQTPEISQSDGAIEGSSSTDLLIYRPGARPKIEESDDYNAVLDSLEDSSVNNFGTEEQEPIKISPVNLASFLGTVVTEGEPPIVFDMDELLDTSSSSNLCQRVYTDTDFNLGNYETDLLDEFRANLTNSEYLETGSEFNIGDDAWISTELERSDILSSTPVSIDVIDLCSEPESTGTLALENTGDRQSKMLAVSDDTPVETARSDMTLVNNSDQVSTPGVEYLSSEVSVSNCSDIKSESEESAVSLIERKRPLDKDDKENDRITLVAHTRDRGISDEEHLVENGDASADSSEECMIVEEQKPNFLLTPKSWVCNCIT